MKKIKLCAAVLNYTKDGGPSFQTQNESKRLVFQRPKRIGGNEKTSPHICLWDIRENLRTGRKRASREFNYLKLRLPEVQTWTANGERDR